MINWIKSLFHKIPDEIVELKKIIETQKQEKEQLQKDLDTLLSRKIPRPSKRVIANAKRKLTRTKNEVKKMETAYNNEDVNDAAKFLRKFSKSK